MIESNSKWVIAPGLKNLHAILLAVAVAFVCLGGARAEVAEGSGRPSAAVPAANSIRGSLASISATAFEPGAESLVDLATFGVPPRVSRLNVPAPGALSPAPPAVDHIPEPGTMGFGIAVAALVFGNVARSFVRCWKITATAPARER